MLNIYRTPFEAGAGHQPLFFMDLPTTILFWLVGLVILWRLYARYEKFKRSHLDSLLQYI